METVLERNTAVTKKIHTQRNLGVDFLRIVSMLMIVILHVLGHGGILKNSVPLSANYSIAWLLETASYCAVNCYALISGYVGYKSKFKLSSVLNIWLQVAFYTVGIGVIAAPMLDSIDRTYVISAFFPVMNNFYWYFTAYFCIYFFTPLFNKIINKLPEKQLKILGVGLIIMFSVIPTLARQDLFFTNRGYSALWLGVLYLLGGIIAKCGLLNKLKGYLLFCIYIVCVVASWGVKLLIEAKLPALNNIRNIFISYTSPTIVIAAVALLVLFSKMKIGKISGKVISIIAPLTFGVYLIHVNKVIWNNLMKDRFIEYTGLNAIELVAAVLITTLSIYLICTVIDFIRQCIFKLFKIKQLLSKLENKLIGKL